MGIEALFTIACQIAAPRSHPRALLEQDIRAILLEHKELLGALIDTAPSYVPTAEDLTGLVTRVLAGEPRIVDAIIHRGTGDRFNGVAGMGTLAKTLISSQILSLTLKTHGAPALAAMFREEIAPSSLYLTGARH